MNIYLLFRSIIMMLLITVMSDSSSANSFFSSVRKFTEVDFVQIDKILYVKLASIKNKKYLFLGQNYKEYYCQYLRLLCKELNFNMLKSYQKKQFCKRNRLKIISAAISGFICLLPTICLYLLMIYQLIVYDLRGYSLNIILNAFESSIKFFLVIGLPIVLFCILNIPLWISLYRRRKINEKTHRLIIESIYCYLKQKNKDIILDDNMLELLYKI